MKRSFGKSIAIAGWAVDSVGAVLFTCLVIFGVYLTRRFSVAVAIILAGGIWSSWQGFKMLQ